MRGILETLLTRCFRAAGLPEGAGRRGGRSPGGPLLQGQPGAAGNEQSLPGKVQDSSGEGQDFRHIWRLPQRMAALAKGRRAEDRSVIDWELTDQDARDLCDAGGKRRELTFPSGSASGPSAACPTCRKYVTSTRAPALMACCRASRRRSGETWSMLF